MICIEILVVFNTALPLDSLSVTDYCTPQTVLSSPPGPHITICPLNCSALTDMLQGLLITDWQVRVSH